MSNLIENEKTRFVANALDRASTGCITVGIATPLAALFYNRKFRRGYRRHPHDRRACGLVFCGNRITYTGKTNTEGTEGMSDWFVAFIISPAAVIALGYAAVLWHEHSMRRNNVKPGE